MASPEPAQEPTPSSPPKPPPLQRTSTFSERLKKSSIPLSFSVHDHFQSVFQLEKTILLKPQNVRFTVGASAFVQKKEISTYGKLEYDVPSKVSLLDGKEFNTCTPTIVLDSSQVELKKKFRAFERNKFGKCSVSLSCGYNFKKRDPFFAFEAVPLNPLILSVGAIGVMKEIGHASGKLEREVKLPFASGSRCKISIPVDVTREKRTNRFRVRANGSACTVKLKEQMITIGNTNKKTTNLLR